jgi:DNA-directed RNA polymerase subunit RPC12/RpoP
MTSKSFGICPACGSKKVLRSRRRGIKERLLKLLSPEIRFYRCHKCGARFKLDGATLIAINAVSSSPNNH